MAEETTIITGKVALIRYTLRNSEGKVLDTSGDDTLPYLHGANNLMPGMESSLEGRKVGDSVKVEIAAADAFGERTPDGPGPQPIPRTAFPEDAELVAGMPFMAESAEGEAMQLYIVEIGDDEITIDIDHPLAGETLQFEAEVTAVRDATDEEKEHGHPHGADGQASH